MLICKNCGAMLVGGIQECCEQCEPIEVEEVTQELLDEISEVKDKKKEIETKDKALSEKIKNIYSNYDIRRVVSNGKAYTMSVTCTPKLDDEGLGNHLAEVLTEAQIEEYHVFDRKLNPEALKNLIADGIVSADTVGMYTQVGNPIKKFVVNKVKPRGEM